MSDLNGDDPTARMSSSRDCLAAGLNAVRALGEVASQHWITSQNLCANCRETQDALRRDVDRSYFIKSEDLRESDCEFCDVLSRALHQCTSVDELGNEDHRMYITMRRGLVQIQFGFEGEVVRLDCEEGFSCPWAIVKREHKLLPTLGSSGSMHQIFSWISRCKSDHVLCNGSNGTFLPTRLIDLGSCNDEIRLVATDFKTQGSYICLSHCWGPLGSKKPLMTTKDNLQKHSKSIPWHTIPRTFQDAICYTRILRLRYIWIDSLCIIQDDPDDWAIESKAMHQIYNYSYLTLGAVTAPNSSAGMFNGSHASPLQAVTQIEGTTISGLPYIYNAFKLSKRSELHPETWKTYTDRKSWPLLGRAWAFQELMISPRFLHIGYPELRWECREEIFCQCGNPYKPLVARKARYADVLDSGDGFELAQQRRELIEAYSMLSLTYYADKLPAFSGLAKQVCRGSASADYLAGLFRDSLVVDMLWHAQTHDPEISGNPTSISQNLSPHSEQSTSLWRAPTWSWASLNAHVVFPLSSFYSSSFDEPNRGSLLESYIRIIDARCTAATSDPTGQVSDGFVTLSGPAFECFINNGELYFAPANGDCIIEGTLRLDQSTPVNRCRLRVLCIRAAKFRRVRTFAAKSQDFEYSLVLECLNASEMKYRRLGVFIQPRGSQTENEPWELKPSSFESGGQLQTVTIV